MSIETYGMVEVTVKENSNVLFLDDSPLRIKKFKSKIPFAITVETAKDCIEELRAGIWQSCWLDHDLGGEIHVDSNREDSGMEVVRWIEENKPKVDSFVIHSLNIVAAKQMEEKLKKCGYHVVSIPFICLNLKVESVKNTGKIT